MQRFTHTPRPAHSPWGAIQQAEQPIPGLWLVSTASHGGMILSEERQAAMPDALRLDSPSYEEDCNWALPVLAFEAEFAASTFGKPSLLQLTHDTARCWHPDRYSAFTGKTVPENSSYALKQRAAYKALTGQWVATTAWGDWADWVPEGHIGFVAREVASVDHLGWPTYTDEQRWYLADKTNWDSGASVRPLAELTVTPIDPPPGQTSTKEIRL